MKRDNEGCGLALTLFLLAVPVAALIHAFTLKVLWAWFAVPALGAPVLSMAGAYGLSLLVSGFIAKRDRKAETEGWSEVAREILRDLSFSLMKAGYLLALGWLVHHFFLV